MINNAHEAYKNLLDKAEDIGYRSPMSNNLYMVLAFFSFHVGNKDLIQHDEMKKIIDEFYDNKLIRRYLGLMNLNKPGVFKVFERGIHKRAAWIEKRRDVYPKNWDFDFSTQHVDGLYYRFTICPIAKLFQENYFAGYTPLFCAMDYKNFALMRENLHRDHIIAKGHGECDFWIVPDSITDPK
ncbi:L-2-amino-thiazoline-4-carboxylic acid hydrolase [Arcanobacterium buesumense]|uniref:L-2-amino-thiazoline-4-carboxylic acid hydrolase n=1 Tax=Arcanobacterium buesumense TaxID=2722751 RepID=A0A6H2EKT3_9ACTO|nr:L-2-amino-thiazoline-4-carboxylic acid hydrolase [Arcanobacterium buesumense]QJC21481.1 L-2-amino-thiazoline-4-carboxylic acid hydrolase [Arcanobacterium buesumense]